MLLNILVHTPGFELQEFDTLAGLQQVTSESIVWVDIESDDIEDLRSVAAHFALHELSIEDCFTPGHFPKFEDFGAHFFAIFRALKTNSEIDDIWTSFQSGEENLPEHVLDQRNQERFTRKVALFFGEKFLISFRRREIPWLDAMVRQIKQHPERTIASGIDVLLHRILDVLVDRFRRGLGYFEELIDKMEDATVESPGSFEIKRGLALKRDLSSLRQVIRDQKAVVNRITSEAWYLIKDNQLRYFKDIDDQTITIIKMLDKEIDSLLSLRDTYFAMSNVRLGDTMRILAIITTLAAPLNIVVGLYGMNFESIPLLHSQYGFWLIVLSMTVMLVLMLLYFRKKQWL